MGTVNLTLDEHRAVTVGEILNLLENHNRVACVRYTGYGKTYYIIKKLMDIFPAKKFMILVPAKSLIKKYNELFNKNNVSIITYQSLLYMNSDKIGEYFSNTDYIICDEVHRLGRNKWRQSIINAFDIIDNGKTKIIGLTATPERGDMVNVVEDFFDGIETSRFDLLDGIQSGYTPKIDYVVAYCDLSGLDKEIYDERMEDVDRYEIDNLLNVSSIIKENIDKDKLTENLKVVLYVSRLKDIDTAKESCYRWFTEAFPNKNIKVFSLSSEYTDKENNDYLYEYSDDGDSSSIDIMISCNKLNEGLHLPKCSVAILLRRTTSPIVYFQQIGRAINGNKPVIFDLVDNSSHIRQIENDFENGNQEDLDLSIKTNKDKKTFSECVNLISKTKEIESILNKYRMTRITDNEIESICNLYKRGANVIEITEKLQRSYGAIRYILQRNGLYTNLSDTREHLVKTINDYHTKGYTQTEIANSLNISAAAVWYYLNKYCKDYVNRNKVDKSNISEQVYKYYKEGYSTYRIGRAINISSKRAKDILMNEYGIKFASIKYQNLSERNENIVNMYKNNASVCQIAEAFNLSSSTISHILAKTNLPTELQKKMSNKEMKICKLYKEGYNLGQISKIVHSGYKTINKILYKNKLLNDENKDKKEKEIEKEICRLYKENYKLNQIRYILHVSYERIYETLEKNNIKRREGRVR